MTEDTYFDWRDGNGESTAISRFMGAEIERLFSVPTAWAEEKDVD